MGQHEGVRDEVCILEQGGGRAVPRMRNSPALRRATLCRAAG